eukprot:TRINITY_DN30571_c0_g1_i1.p2 TRINITY_DN30571_c0_g1~~TRINITY_DN30571_c0_g1_i1.p2  ORF type:complete len:141 (+),score=22.91 TRINITY_DN30571_c0_g1_i1:61-483(+)
MFTSDVLVPARFLTSVGQLLCTVSIFLDKEPHILAGLPRVYTRTEFDAADTDFTKLLAVSSAFLALELVTLMSGLTFFHDGTNALHCCFHGFGVLAAACFALFSCHFGFFTHIFWIANVPPLFVEVCALASIFWLRTSAL